MTKIKYFLSRKTLSIGAADITNESEHMIYRIDETGKEVREAKNSNWGSWYDSFETALNTGIDIAEERVEREKQLYLKTLSRLEQLKRIKAKWEEDGE